MVSRTMSKLNFPEGQGSIIASFEDMKTVKNVREYVGFVELLAGALAIAGVVGFVAKYFIAQTHVVEPYVLPTFFLGLLLFFIRPGLEIEKLHYRYGSGCLFWTSFALCAITSVFQWSWLIYKMVVANAGAALKINSIGNAVFVVLLLAQLHLKAVAKGLSMRTLGGKFEWCGIFTLWAAAPALQILTCWRRFGANRSVSFTLMTVCLGFTLIGIVMILVGEHEIEQEEEEESQESEPLRPDKIDRTSGEYKATQSKLSSKATGTLSDTSSTADTEDVSGRGDGPTESV